MNPNAVTNFKNKSNKGVIQGKQRNSETGKLRNRNSEQSYIHTTTDTQQLKPRGLNTQTNKLNKGTRGRG